MAREIEDVRVGAEDAVLEWQREAHCAGDAIHDRGPVLLGSVRRLGGHCREVRAVEEHVADRCDGSAVRRPLGVHRRVCRVARSGGAPDRRGLRHRFARRRDGICSMRHRRYRGCCPSWYGRLPSMPSTRTCDRATRRHPRISRASRVFLRRPSRPPSASRPPSVWGPISGSLRPD